MGSTIPATIVAKRAYGSITKDTFVSLHTTEGYVTTCTSGVPYGIAINSASDGEIVNVAIAGGANLVVVDSSVSIGALLGPTTGGKGTVVTADKATYGARAEEAGTAANNVLAISIEKGYISAS